MTRFASSSNATEAAKVAVQIRLMVALDFASGFVRAHDGVGPIVFGGNTYTGIGVFGSIESVSEDIDVIARPLRMTLSGIDSSLITTAMTEEYQGRSATIYLAFVNPETNALVDTPETVWEGRMDSMSIEISRGQATINLSCEPRLRREPRIARYSSEDQQLAYATDTFFDLVMTIPTFKGFWGARTSQYGNQFPANLPWQPRD